MEKALYNETHQHILWQINNLDIFKVIDDNLAPIKKLAQRFLDCSTVLVLGTGGSSLGGKCLVNFQANMTGTTPRIVFIENVDSLSFKNTISKCDPARTGIVVISKSGRTTETLMTFLTLCEIWKNFDYQNRAIAITELSDNNDLRQIANSLNMEILEHNPRIGGRFSVFSVVGLLPALLGNVDIDTFTKAAKKILDEVKENAGAKTFSDACEMYDKAFKNGLINQHVIMPYSDMLEDYTKWAVQLISESLGKSEDFGITPIRAVGTVDQHSMLQLFLGGPANKFYTIILARNNAPTAPIAPALCGKVLEHLKGHTINELMYAHAKATIQVLKAKSPVRVLEYDEINIATLGELMAKNFIEVLVIAHLANVNPFDQPAVEESKHLALQYLNSSKGK
ncbi:MAG: hypothetical protein II670_07520 [Alphaproteobacteria bacterium]|nr:hypothetical protein [Alphaproteobacteria bacterium]